MSIGEGAAFRFEPSMKNERISSRHKAREIVTQTLYGVRFFNSDPEKSFDQQIAHYVRDKNWNFAYQLYRFVLNGYTEYERIYQEHLENPDVKHIALIDRVIIEIAICEFLQFEDIPVEVTINEAIEICKTFSTPGSVRFINGLLDTVAKRLVRSGTIQKSGRGLISKKIKS